MPRSRCSSCLPALAALIAVAAAVGAQDDASPLAPCRLGGVGEEILCGKIEVWEDRAAAAGRRIGLEVAVFPALATDPEPDPLFFLAGGPGQSAVAISRSAAGLFRKIRENRDLVFVDQRGTGDSNPLECPEELLSEEERESLELFPGDDLAPNLRRDVLAKLLARCRESLDADLRLYTTPIAMDDLDDVRAALGYERINLYGGSYGTRAALIYMRRHPERVRSAILDGAAPTAIRLPMFMAPDAQRALDRLLADCRDDEGCREAFPSLAEDLATVLDDLGAEPRRVEARHPTSGEQLELAVTRDLFAGMLRNILYSPTLASLAPVMIRQALDGSFDTFLALSLGLTGRSETSLAMGMMLSVLCAEDLPRLDRAAAVGEAEPTFLGAALVDQFAEACADWPVGELPEGYWEPVASAVPTLVLSGDLDPVTPPRWGEEVVGHLSAGRHLVGPGAGHGVISTSCVPDLAADFVAAGTAEGLDASCLERGRRPPFFLSTAGPAP
ncbi:MAG: alpha/beta fold hydrolase [Thermoanaerobaculia bacterium]|nr:alpha/beta fold hydrolase [Thermoanaerobaculia bacterium]